MRARSSRPGRPRTDRRRPPRRRDAELWDDGWDEEPADGLEEEADDEEPDEASRRLRRRRPAARSRGAAPAADEGGVPSQWHVSTGRLAWWSRATTVALWAAIAAGPLALTVAVAARPEPAPKPPAAVKVPDVQGQAAVSAFAELYVATYLEVGASTADRLRTFYPASVQLTGQDNARTASRTVTLGARETQAGYWSVTVGASVLRMVAGGWVNDGVHYFQVPVLAVPGAQGGPSGYVAAALPAEVTAPPSLESAQLAYRGAGIDLSSPAGDTAAKFLSAYLTGAGDLARYLTPGTPLTAVTPAPYTAVKVSSLAALSEDADGRIAADGSTRRVLVTVQATDRQQNTWPLMYALTLTARAGRWEVSSLDAAPALREGASPAAQQPPAATSLPTAAATPTGAGASGHPTAPGTAGSGAASAASGSPR